MSKEMSTVTNKEPLMHISKRDGIETWKSWLIRIIAVLLSLVVCAGVIVALTGLNPIEVYKGIFDGAIGTKRRAWMTIRDTLVLLCIAVGITPAFKMRFWNIGAEGQVLIGGVTSAAMMIYLGNSLPPVVLFLLMFLGSAAAPTAELHFTKELLQKIRDIGCEEVFVTLHVGLGTFRPVSVDDIKDHVMHREFYSVSPEAAEAINKAKAEGRRIVAVGTTAVRTLEAAGESGVIKAGGNWTNIFIYPGYRFRLVNSLITNFHLPQSTLLMLVSALSTREIMLSTYAEAVREHYRFFSFGDAMFITDLNK